MLKELINEIKNIYVQKEIPKEFFEFQLLEPKGIVYAVDGGSSIIFDGGSWCISKIKVGVVGYKGKKRVVEKIKTFYALSKKDNEHITTKIMPEGKIMKSKNLEDAHNDVRTFLEAKEVKELYSKTSADDIILVDGPTEVLKKNIVGVNKTSRLRAKSGRSLIGLINEFGSKKLKGKMWYYEIGNNEYIVKLHPKSKFCYKITALSKELFGVLAYFSRDPEIVGYPYPLIKVDKIARVKEDEKKMENNKIKLMAKKEGLILDYDENAAIMHSLLDKRMYR
ncbi:MAG: hypothetical protein J7K22_01395 [Nanoarchaeota archaeon]|nr:hypothetical protein [Nanoarchaeota archaeon]